MAHRIPGIGRGRCVDRCILYVFVPGSLYISPAERGLPQWLPFRRSMAAVSRRQDCAVLVTAKHCHGKESPHPLWLIALARSLGSAAGISVCCQEGCQPSSPLPFHTFIPSIAHVPLVVHQLPLREEDDPSRINHCFFALRLSYTYLVAPLCSSLSFVLGCPSVFWPWASFERERERQSSSSPIAPFLTHHPDAIRSSG